MADCIVCGTKLGILSGDEHNRCDTCSRAQKWPDEHPLNPEWLVKQANIREKEKAEIETILLTTENNPDIKIQKRIEIITAECAFGMNMFKDLFAGVRDVFGGRSEAIQKTMRDSRRTVLWELKKEAHLVGANAVVGVDLDYVEMSSAGSMVLMVASGTAVVVEEK
jgi:uncharacterized protein YbjQ (UPF0145 family)